MKQRNSLRRSVRSQLIPAEYLSISFPRPLPPAAFPQIQWPGIAKSHVSFLFLLQSSSCPGPHVLSLLTSLWIESMKRFLFVAVIPKHWTAPPWCWVLPGKWACWEASCRNQPSKRKATWKSHTDLLRKKKQHTNLKETPCKFDHLDIFVWIYKPYRHIKQ